MKSVRLSVEAKADLDSIIHYLAQQGGAAPARKVLREIRSAFRFLAETPGAGHLRTDLTDEPVRFWTVYSYLIVYDPVARPIAIVRILHGARDLTSLLGAQPPRS